MLRAEGNFRSACTLNLVLAYLELLGWPVPLAHGLGGGLHLVLHPGLLLALARRGASSHGCLNSKKAEGVGVKGCGFQENSREGCGREASRGGGEYCKGKFWAGGRPSW